VSLASSIADAVSNATADYQSADMIDVLGLLISNLPAIIAAVAGCSVLVVAIRGQRKGKDKRQEDRPVLDGVSKKVTGVTTDVKAVRRQVNNDHPEEENLRDQMDYMQRQNDLLTELIKDQNTVLEEIKARQNDHGATFAASEPSLTSCMAATESSRPSTTIWCDG
jgi:hypothetical protein